MKTKLCALALVLTMFTHPAIAQDARAFFRGDVFPAARTEPAAWLMELHKADDFFGSNIAVAEFLPNTRIAWHHHPGGQILLITDGVGYYQEKGKPKQIMRKGDVIRCPPGVEHWHGGALESGVTYIAISPAQKGGTVWGAPVSDEDYGSRATDRRASRRGGKLSTADDTFPFDVTTETFAAGKKRDWHSDAGGEILIVTDGAAYHQEKGQPKQLLRKGDIVKSAPGVEHWQGAASEVGATLITITPQAPGRPVASAGARHDGYRSTTEEVSHSPITADAGSTAPSPSAAPRRASRDDPASARSRAAATPRACRTTRTYRSASARPAARTSSRPS